MYPYFFLERFYLLDRATFDLIFLVSTFKLPTLLHAWSLLALLLVLVLFIKFNGQINGSLYGIILNQIRLLLYLNMRKMSGFFFNLNGKFKLSYL